MCDCGGSLFAHLSDKVGQFPGIAISSVDLIENALVTLAWICHVLVLTKDAKYK